MTLRIVSGAQTGADVAGLWAAKLFGIETGGWAPKTFLTLHGEHPEMANTFGIKEHTRSYRGRTIENLKSSDLTICCSGKMTAGTTLTIKQCKEHGVPCIVFRIDQEDLSTGLSGTQYDQLLSALKKAALVDRDFVLNVAGNSSDNCPRAFEFTFKLLHKLFTELGYKSEVKASEWPRYQDRWE